MIKFTNIEASNFLSYKELDFDLTNQGLTLIEGISDVDGFNANGCGKTVLLNTAVYALFGRLGQQTGIGSDDVVNRQVGKNTRVVLEFDKEGTDYRIERYRKHSKNKNNVLLFENGNEITEGSIKETNQKILNILGIDYKTFANAIMVGGSDEPLFMDSTDKGKKEILEDITNISIYNKSQEVAKNKLSILEDRLKLNKEEEIRLKDKKQELQDLKIQEEEKIKEIKDNISKEEKLLEEYKKDLQSEDYDKLIKNLELQIKELENKPITNNDEQTEELDKSLQEINSKILTMEQSVREKERAITDTINRYRNQINQLDTTDICPTCGSKLDATHAKKEYERLSELVNEEEIKINKLDIFKVETLEPLTTELRESEAELLQAKKELIEATNKEQAEKYQKITELNTKIQKLNSDKTIKSERVVNQERIIESLTNAPKPKDYTEDIKEIDKELKDISKQVKELNKEIEILVKVVDLYSRKGVQSTVLDMVVPFLNKSANHYLGKLSGGTLEVNFTTQIKTKGGDLRDKFDVEVINERGGGSYGLSSQGEKRRIDVAVTLALQDLVMTNANLETNIIFFDEVFEGLDDKGVEGVIEILREKSEIFESVFVITHNNSLKPLFDNTITVEKREGVSKILSN